MSLGTRIEVVGGPWPERVGCVGVIVAAPADGTYPQPSSSEVIVLLDADPLAPHAHGHLSWSCVVSKRSVRPVQGEPR